MRLSPFGLSNKFLFNSRFPRLTLKVAYRTVYWRKKGRKVYEIPVVPEFAQILYCTLDISSLLAVIAILNQDSVSTQQHWSDIQTFHNIPMRRTQRCARIGKRWTDSTMTMVKESSENPHDTKFILSDFVI